MRLSEWQNSLGAALGGQLDPALLTVIEESDDSQAPPSLTALRRLEIYYRNVEGAKLSALSATYPLCREIMGQALFDRLVLQYAHQDCIDGQPCANLNHYGKGFPRLIGESDQHLGQLAQTEYFVHQAYYARDDLAFDWTRLNQVPHDAHSHLRLFTSFSFALVASAMPLVSLWEQPPTACGEYWQFLLKNVDSGERFFTGVYRKTFHAEVFQLESVQFLLLRDIQHGHTLAQLLRRHTDVLENLQTFITNGWVTGFEVSDTGSRHV